MLKKKNKNKNGDIIIKYNKKLIFLIAYIIIFLLVGTYQQLKKTPMKQLVMWI